MLLEVVIVAVLAHLFQYPLFRIVDCFSAQHIALDFDASVSISALSDRGLLHIEDGDLIAQLECFNIRSFGSWIASTSMHDQCFLTSSFNIRSFGSWIASVITESVTPSSNLFQYPLFRIVDCFGCVLASNRSPLSGFNIRSFGSWIASKLAEIVVQYVTKFQYPLFRIVDCFEASGRKAIIETRFQYPLFRIVDCFIDHRHGGQQES